MFIYSKYICYDDGCHLRKFAQNSNRRQQSITTQWLGDLEIVVDKIHLKCLNAMSRGHVALSGCNFTTSCQRGSVANLNCGILDVPHPKLLWVVAACHCQLCWMWSGGALIQVSAL